MRRATLSAPPVFEIAEQVRGRITLKADTGAVAHIFVLEDDIVRLLLLPDGAIKGPPSWAIAPGAEDIAEPGRDRMSVEGFTCPAYALTVAGALTLETARIRLVVQLAGFHCRWFQRDGDDWRPMAEDRPTQAYDFGWWDGKVRHYLARQPGERFYGLGEKAGAMDRAGRRFRLISLDPMGYDAELSDPLYKTIPYILVADTGGACHGAFYDTMADVSFDFGQEMDNYHGAYRYCVAESGDLDLYMIAGPDPAAVTRRFTWLSGRPAMMPRWSVGYSGSTMTYTDAPDAQAQMAEFITRLEEHDIGCSSFHFSSGYTSIGAKRYVFNWNREKFPDPAAFVKSYRDAGIELVPNIKPALLRDHPRYAEVAAKGLFVSDEEGNVVEGQYWDELCAFLDFTNPDAAAWWRENLTGALLDFGIRSTWNDNNEYGVWDARAAFAFWGEQRPAAEARPLQAMLMSRASRAAQLAHDPDRRPYLVTRSGMTGLHRYAQTWSGDNRTDWKTIRYNTKMALGLALSGVSNSGHDVGGFAGRKPEPELFLRWVQAGVMMPRFSIHSWNDDRSVNEPWMYPQVLPAIRRLMALRQTLTPFLYDLLWRYHRDYEPVVRPLWLDFPADQDAWTDGDDHMLGRDLLVALVCDEGATRREVRAPAGADWIDVWTGDIVRGGETVTLHAPLDGPPPLLARAGSGIAVDLARGGFRPGPFVRGLWLFPTVGDGRFSWSFAEDEGEGLSAGDTWSGDCVCDGDEIRVDVHREGPGGFGDNRISILLPPGEKRRLSIENGESRAIEIDGRRGVTTTVS
ncbi:glycoside hydrolase family 31 protein [Sphingomonas immobilis]|uniref:Glycoside hydrolase family 31 protein n=1 Tax=Sphingomonas immobilis TaxID=3063997 RepID=A0ABT9A3F7_9SPHN|nr:glycoside hydrolase family 31 protein [Sphingomonas sp. CA1-15]MDO7843516.1 glycoside hydrolase family 31 protein [Sphingomonas sp. CA1-15]